MANYTLTGIYSQTLYTITVSAIGTWITGSSIVINFTSGSAPDGKYIIATGGTNSFTVTSQVSTTTNGSCTLTVTGIVPKIASDIQKLYAGKLIDLFELDATNLSGGSIYRFHAGLNELGDDIIWQGQTYARFPIEVEGLEISSSNTGPPARPTIKVSNYDGLMGAEVRLLGGLLTAKLTRRRTFVKYLDAVNFAAGNLVADSNAYFPDEIWFVDRKSKENAVFIEFELVSALDITGVLIPYRQCIQNTCTWAYKSAECGWIPGTYYTKGDVVTSIGNDSCGKRLSSCKVRFGEFAQLPYGGFPGVGLF